MPNPQRHLLLLILRIQPRRPQRQPMEGPTVVDVERRAEPAEGVEGELEFEDGGGGGVGDAAGRFGGLG